MEILKKGNDLLLSQILKEVFFYLYIIFLIKIQNYQFIYDRCNDIINDTDDSPNLEYNIPNGKYFFN